MTAWRAFQSAFDKRFWGIEVNDPDKEEEAIVPPCMEEHNAKAIVEAHNLTFATPKGESHE